VGLKVDKSNFILQEKANQYFSNNETDNPISIFSIDNLKKHKEGLTITGCITAAGLIGLSLLCKKRSPKTCVKNIKFKNFEQVKNYSKKQIIKALKKKNPYERLTIINKDNNTLVALVEGKESEVNSDVLMLVNPLGRYSVEHGHPTICMINGKPVSDPLSFSDYIAAIRNHGAEEVIAYDIRGNFSMLRKKPDFKKLDYETIKHYEQLLMQPLEDIYLKKMLACLPKEYQSVKSKEELFSIYDQLIESGKLTSELNLKFLKGIEETEKITPKELYIIDKFWRTHADDLGVIYETNYEYLKNL